MTQKELATRVDMKCSIDGQDLPQSGNETTPAAMTDAALARENCQRFANKHKVVFEDRGEVGFGRPCVGFTKGSGYLDIHPRTYPNYDDAWPYDGRVDAPAGVTAYHKHDCLCVLVEGDDYDAAIQQLDAWVRHLEAQGSVEVTDFSTGAHGIQALLSGVIGYGLRFTGAAPTPEEPR